MGRIKCMVIIAFWSCLFAAPPVSSTDRDMVIITTTPPFSDKETKETTLEKPIITAMDISSNITNRFAHTLIKSKVQNPSKVTQETTFFVIMPAQAYISSFTMEIGGNYYTAHVQGKEEAKKTYKEAVANGTSAAHVSVRHSNKFTVRVNVEREAMATFYLTYEELLERKFGYYEQIINIHPKQLVKSINVMVEINELRRLTFVKTPSIRSGNKVTKESEDLDPKAKIDRPENNKAIVKFSPDITRQKQIAHCLGTDEKEGMSGQFVIQYDVERDPQGGEVLINGGYFVHFFAPSYLESLRKYVVFVMDGSTSMAGAKMKQLKEAMKSILKELKPNDLFNLIVYDSRVSVLNLDRPSESTIFPQTENTYYDSNLVFDITNVSFPQTYPVNKNTIEKAQKAITGMRAKGATITYEALRVGVHLVKLNQQRTGDIHRQGIVFFLTDGEATVGRTTPESIMAGIAEENTINVPIISLSFGNDANRRFLEKISLKNRGFTRHIYEESDAALQLENFYKEVSSPRLHNVKFSYTYDVTSLTQTEFPTFFAGSEFVVAGKIPDGNFKFDAEVSGNGPTGPLVLRPTVNRTVGQLERLWAYMTVKKYFDELKMGGDNIKDIEKKALDLALKFSFVTPVTSLVVVKPIESNEVASKDADSSVHTDFEANFNKSNEVATKDADSSGFFDFNQIAIGGSGFDGDITPGGGDGRTSVSNEVPSGSHPSIAGGSGFGKNVAPSEAPGSPSDFIEGSGFGEDGAAEPPSDIIEGSGFGEDGAAETPSDIIEGSGFDGDIAPGGAAGPPSDTNKIPSGSYPSIAGVDKFGSPCFVAGPPSNYPAFPAPARPGEDLLPPKPQRQHHRTITEVVEIEEELPFLFTTPKPATLIEQYKLDLFTTPTPTTQYEVDFAWLKEHMGPEGILFIKGGNYQFGGNETSPAHQECTTPKREEGLCKLITDCEILLHTIKTVKQFEDNFCVIKDKFAGVCCPK